MPKENVVVCRVGEKAFVETVDNYITYIRFILGRDTEAYCLFDDDAILVCQNKKVKENLQPNRAIYDKEGNVKTIISGTFVIVSTDKDGIGNLSNEKAAQYRDLFLYPEKFLFPKDNPIIIEKIMDADFSK